MDYYFMRNHFTILSFPILYLIEMNYKKQHEKLFNIITSIILPIFYVVLFVRYNHFGILFWGITQTLCLTIMINNKLNFWYALNTSLMGVFGFSWLYEILIMNKIDFKMFYSSEYPLSFHSDLICLFFYFLLLIKGELKIDKNIKICIWIFLLWELFFMVLYNSGILNMIYLQYKIRLGTLLTRGGASILLLNISKSIKSCEK